MDYNLQQKAEIVKLYYKHKYPKIVQNVLKKQYPDNKVLSRFQILRIVKKFERKGSVKDERHLNPGPPKKSRSDENIDRVRSIIEETPRKSVRSVFREMECDNVSVSSVFRILRIDLCLTAYKISIMQHLKPTDIKSRLDFAMWIERQSQELVDTIWFSDEAHFYLTASVNKENMRFWGSEKPKFYEEKHLHADKITVWAAISSTGIIGPYFFEDPDGECVSVNAERYLNLLKSKFLPAL